LGRGREGEKERRREDGDRERMALKMRERGSFLKISVRNYVLLPARSKPRLHRRAVNIIREERREKGD